MHCGLPVPPAQLSGDSQTLDEMTTPHASKHVALEAVAGAELSTLQVNPRNGAKSVPFKRAIRVKLGGSTRDFATPDT